MKKRISDRRKRKRMVLWMMVLFWGLSAFTCAGMLINTDGRDKIQTEGEIGKQYLAAAFPSISRGGDSLRVSTVNGLPADSRIINSGNLSGNFGKENNKGVVREPQTANIRDSVASKEPLVLIYHTHATESYQPVSAGNFHSLDEKGTVREVGGVLKSALESKGISVIHDTAIHDSPSYSKSYSRSLEAATRILSTNPSVRIIVDLHRDAAAYTGNSKQTFLTGGKEAARFTLVVGEGNDNSAALKAFAGRVNQKANSLYPGFGKGVIIKEYRYNQYIADNYILLEMGNNQNDIEEAKLSALMFADVLAEILKE
ncbi:hypothetical protein MASR2M70_13980 [Bacillota bacterium]